MKPSYFQFRLLLVPACLVIGFGFVGCASQPSSTHADHAMSCDCKECKMKEMGAGNRMKGMMGDMQKTPSAAPPTQPSDHASHHPG
jgi:hypothetical protein